METACISRLENRINNRHCHLAESLCVLITGASLCQGLKTRITYLMSCDKWQVFPCMFSNSTNLSLWIFCSSVQAPGELNCPSLQVGPRVITDHSCTSGPSVPGTVCSFDCPKGYKLSGPSLKHCKIDGSWTDAALAVSCDGKYLYRTPAACRTQCS